MTDTYPATRRKLGRFLSDSLPPGLDVSVDFDDQTSGAHLVISRGAQIVGAEFIELWAKNSVQEAWLRLRARAWASAATTPETT